MGASKVENKGYKWGILLILIFGIIIINSLLHLKFGYYEGGIFDNMSKLTNQHV